MNILLVLIISLAAFIGAYIVYAKYISQRCGFDPAIPPPSVRLKDGRDYVPTDPSILFGHHFATIAGAGPILGPTLGILFGFYPTWLWILLGAIFFGAVHDTIALFVSIREDGRSIGEIASKSLGSAGFVLFVGFCIIFLILYTSSLLSAAVTSLTSIYPLAELGLSPDQTLLRVVNKAGVSYGAIGGIASTSVIVITIGAPIVGYLVYKKGIKIFYAYLLAGIICIISVLIGIQLPVNLHPDIWMVALSIYILFASALPVWFLLQPRDFTNVQILYGGLILLIIGVFISGISGTTVQFPDFAVDQGIKKMGAIWPMLFITVACGAISGFHAIVSTGTTAKQIKSEGHIIKIIYGGMLLESLLAILVILALASSLPFEKYLGIVWPSDPAVRSNPILAFSLAVGMLLNHSVGISIALGTVFGILLVEGFVATSLDSAVRLNRYLFEEIWVVIFRGKERVPRLLLHPYFNAAIVVGLMLLFARTNAFSALWPLFGASNQLVAVLTLVVAAMWMYTKRRPNLFLLIPAIFMFVTTINALILLLEKYIKEKNYLLIGSDIILITLTAMVIGLSLIKFYRIYSLRKKAS